MIPSFILSKINCTWWSTPTWITDLVKPKGATTLKFIAYKYKGGWYFDKPTLLTWKEALVFTEALDELADGHDKLKFTLSSEPIKGGEKAWYFQDDPIDTSASHYYWKDHLIWLCGWLPWYFGCKPTNLWFTAIPM